MTAVPVTPTQSRMPTTPTESRMPREQPQQRHEVASGSGHQPVPAAQPASSARTWLDASASLPNRDAVVSPTGRMMAGTAEIKDDIVVTKDEPPTPSFLTVLRTTQTPQVRPAESATVTKTGPAEPLAN